MKRIICLFLISLTCNIQAESPFKFYTLNAKQGLSSNRIQSIAKDNYGFMWFATRNGLNRYDGYQIRHYTAKKESNFLAVKVDASGTIWAKTELRWYYYEAEKDNLNADISKRLKSLGIKENIQDIQIDVDKNLWCWSYRHVFYYDFQKSRLSIYPAHEKIVSSSFCHRNRKTLLMDKMGNIKSLNIANGKQSQLFHYPYPVAEDINIYMDSFDRLWIYVPDMPGLHCYNATTFKEIQVFKNQEPEDCAITQVIDDEDGFIWVATNAGIYKINGYNFSIEHIQKNTNPTHSLNSNHICSLYKDNTGILWIGTGREGVCYQQLNKTIFNTFLINTEDITCILQDKQGSIWLGTDGNGLIKWDFDKGRNIYNTTNSKLASNFIISSYLDQSGNIWLGTYKMGTFLMRDNGFFALPYPNTTIATSPINHVRKITCDPQGTIWLGSNLKGVFGYTTSHTFIHYDTKNSKLQTNSITDIYSFGENLWIATSYGLYLMDIKNKSLSPFTIKDKQPLAEEYIECVLEDTRGLIWVGTQNGLFVYNKESEKLTKLTVQDGLSHQHVLGIVEDLQHNIWTSTGNGLTHILIVPIPNQEEPNIRCYPYIDIDGLGDITFTPRCIIRTADGTILSGSTGKLLVFKPSETMYNINKKAKVIFTDLHIANEIVRAGEPMSNGRIVLNKNLYMLEEIRLKYSDHYFAIDVSTMNYGNEHKLKYQYRLNKNDDWTNLDGNRIYFNQLSYGRHLLEVRVKNSLGINTSSSTLSIYVEAPFWLSPYAYCLYALILIGVCLYGYRQYKLNILKRQKRLTRKHIEEMNEAKMTFFTNVSHDLKTPLSLITIPLEKILKTNEQKNLSEDLLLMKKNVEILKSEVTQLLDFRKLDQHKDKYMPSYGSITSFITEICKSFEPLNEGKSITLSVIDHGENIEMDFDKEKIQRILLNLLSNAYKYNVKGGKIEVDMQKEDINGAAFIKIQVRDTGIGIKNENKEKIFERFYQEKTTHAYIGNGIGLHIVKEYVALHHGKITVSDNSPQGSIFTITLPITRHMEHQQKPRVDKPTEELQFHPSTTPLQERPRILLVEDHEDFRKFTARTLKENYDILQASNGKEALQIIEREDVNIIISDIMMPVMDGLELCHKVKTDIRFSHIPVILLTARTTEEHILEGFKDGADEYITKPFNMDILILRINKILEWTKNNHIKSNTMDISPSEITVSSLDEQLMSNILQYIEENMANEDLSVEDLSASMGLSRGHLYKKLISITGKSPIEIIRVLRIKRGKQLLEQSQKSISEIAYEVGMSPKQFSKFFKEEYGMLPSDYKKIPKEKS